MGIPDEFDVHILDKTSNLAQAGSLLLVLNIAWLAPCLAGLNLSQGERLSNLVSWGIFLLIGGAALPGAGDFMPADFFEIYFYRDSRPDGFAPL